MIATTVDQKGSSTTSPLYPNDEQPLYSIHDVLVDEVLARGRAPGGLPTNAIHRSSHRRFGVALPRPIDIVGTVVPDSQRPSREPASDKRSDRPQVSRNDECEDVRTVANIQWPDRRRVKRIAAGKFASKPSTRSPVSRSHPWPLQSGQVHEELPMSAVDCPLAQGKQAVAHLPRHSA